MQFFVGFHHPGRVDQVGRPCMLSANALRDRKSDLPLCNGDRWLMDSGAFSQVAGEAGFHDSPAEYAIEVARWSRCGRLVAAATQDYMCEPHILDRMDRNAKDQQERTVKRYLTIKGHLNRLECETYLLPVLQGWTPRHYKRHVMMYEHHIADDAWVGVGSICKWNVSPADVERILSAIKTLRPDLRLHGFGVKATALQRPAIRDMLYSADSQAWSFRARQAGEDANDPAAARRFYDSIMEPGIDMPLFQQPTNGHA